MFAGARRLRGWAFGTGEGGQPDKPERTPVEALIYTAKWRGFLYKSEFMALTELLDEQAGATTNPGLLRTLVGTPRRRRKAVKRLFTQAGCPQISATSPESEALCAPLRPRRH